MHPRSVRKRIIRFHQTESTFIQTKAPKLMNYHAFHPLPYRDVTARPKDLPEHLLFNVPNALKSLEYMRSGIPQAQLGTGKASPICKDIPLPSVLMRHVLTPSETLKNNESVGKIVGFRLQVKGRRGSRSKKDVFGYGTLGLGDIGSYFVDFGRSHYITKRGAIGVRVWVSYAK